MIAQGARDQQSALSALLLPTIISLIIFSADRQISKRSGDIDCRLSTVSNSSFDIRHSPFSFRPRPLGSLKPFSDFWLLVPTICLLLLYQQFILFRTMPPFQFFCLPGNKG
jgi:hypothetical protein